MRIDQLFDALLRAMMHLADLPAEPGALECADAVRARRSAHELEIEHLSGRAPSERRGALAVAFT